MAEVTRKSFSTLDRLARSLKQGGKEQVPRGMPGGGKNAAHYLLQHFANFMLGLAADPITEAPSQVEGFADLQCWGNQKRIIGLSPARDAIVNWSEAIGKPGDKLRTIPGETLIEAIKNIIDGLNGSQGKELRSTLGQGTGRLYLDLVTKDGFRPSATIGLFEQDVSELWSGAGFVAQYGYGPYQKPTFTVKDGKVEFEETKSPASQEPTMVGSVQKTVRIPYAVFEAMADLWADTQARMEQPSHDTAASQPLQGPSAAAFSLANDQPANGLGGPSQRHPTRKRKGPQSPSRPRTGHPITIPSE